MNKKEMNNKQSDLQKRYPKRKKTGDKQQDEPEMESGKNKKNLKKKKIELNILFKIKRKRK